MAIRWCSPSPRVTPSIIRLPSSGLRVDFKFNLALVSLYSCGSAFRLVRSFVTNHYVTRRPQVVSHAEHCKKKINGVLLPRFCVSFFRLVTHMRTALVDGAAFLRVRTTFFLHCSCARTKRRRFTSARRARKLATIDLIRINAQFSLLAMRGRHRSSRTRRKRTRPR